MTPREASLWRILSAELEVIADGMSEDVARWRAKVEADERGERVWLVEEANPDVAIEVRVPGF